MIVWFETAGELDTLLATRVDVDAPIAVIGTSWAAWDVAAKTRRLYEAYDFLRGGPFSIPDESDVPATTADLRSALVLFAYRLTTQADLLETITELAAQTKARANFAEVTQTANLVKVYGVRVLALLHRYRRDAIVGQDLF